MINDQRRWRLHTAANQENDLQAWYHSVFHKEVRLELLNVGSSYLVDT